MKECTKAVCRKAPKHGVQCPYCDFSAGSCAEHVYASSLRVQAHLDANHPGKPMPPQHG